MTMCKHAPTMAFHTIYITNISITSFRAFNRATCKLLSPSKLCSLSSSFGTSSHQSKCLATTMDNPRARSNNYKRSTLATKTSLPKEVQHQNPVLPKQASKTPSLPTTPTPTPTTPPIPQWISIPNFPSQRPSNQPANVLVNPKILVSGSSISSS